MKRILLTVLLLPVLLTGCTSYRQLQLEQTMLLQENQRLEDALYVTHAQLTDSKQENETLKISLAGPSSSSAPTRPSRGITAQDADDDAPLYPPSKFEIPPNSELKSTPEKSSLPDLLKKTRMPPRNVPKPRAGIPDLVPPDAGVSIIDDAVIDAAGDAVNVGDTMPVWKPTRQH